MKNIVIITARMLSHRLPGKVLMKNKFNTMLEFLINRVKKSKFIDNIVVATSINSADDEIIKILKKIKIDFFRGSENNVTERVCSTAKKFKVDNIILITGDCPLIDYEIIDQCFRIFKMNNCDFLTNANIRSYPDGMDVQIFTKKVLIRSLKNIKSNIEKEHVTLNIRKNFYNYKSINLIAPPDHFYPKLGLTLDEEADYELINNIINKLYENKKYFNCLDIINFLKKNPNLIVNKNILRRGDT